MNLPGVNIFGRSSASLANHVKELEISELRRQFKKEVQDFIRKAGVPEGVKIDIKPESNDASPVYVVTGASFTQYDPEIHRENDKHSFSALTDEDGNRYLLNNTAAIFENLAKTGDRVVIHTKHPDIATKIARLYGMEDRIEIVEGPLDDNTILPKLYKSLANMTKNEPASTVRMALYQSFAQNNGEPFKPMHRETHEEVERAANKRIRFVYNMAAMGYDLMVNQNLDDLRIVSLSALASSRATYGLLADAADKYMNELVWRTFHHEANFSTGKPVSVYQLNPGITTACDVYEKGDARKIVKMESLADGFPLDDDIFLGRQALPQLSSDEIALVAEALLKTPNGENPNEGLAAEIRETLFGGFDRDELERRIRDAIQQDENGIDIDADRILPEHILTPQTSYGQLPKKMRLGDYRRISMTPKGQRF